MGPPLVTIEGLRVWYGTVEALKGISLELFSGQILAVVGPNGAGKTTLLRSVFGEQRKKDGVVRVVGLDPFCRRARKSLWKVARYVGDTPIFYDYLSMREWLRFQARAYGVPDREVDYMVMDRATDFEIAGLLDKPIRELSLGDKQKVHVAGGFFSGEQGPRVLVLDEPTNAMDPPSRRELAEILRRWSRQGSKASDRGVLISSHNLGELSALADSVVLLSSGSVAAEGQIEELIATSEAVLSYVVTLFDENAGELARRLQDYPRVKDVKARGKRTVTFSCPNIPDAVQEVVRLLALDDTPFRLQEMKEQRSPLDRIFEERVAERDNL